MAPMIDNIELRTSSIKLINPFRANLTIKIDRLWDLLEKVVELLFVGLTKNGKVHFCGGGIIDEKSMI